MIRSLRAFVLHLPSLGIGLTFMTLSILFGSWLARLPEIQARLSLSEGQLGLALLGLPFGSLTAAPLAAWLLKRVPTGSAASWSTLVACTLIVFPPLANNIWTLMASLALLGLAVGTMNVSINTAAAGIEKAYRIRIMSLCHGMFSLGAMIGAGSSGLIAMADVPLLYHLSGVAILLLSLQVLIRPILLELPNEEAEEAAFAMPPRAVWGIALIGFCIMMGEGTIADWSAVYLTKTLQSNPFVAGLGYAGFSLAMAMGRFYGDMIRQVIPAKQLLLLGSLIGAAGLALALVVPVPALAVLGFSIAGLGFSTLVPILFSAGANAPGVAPGVGVAAVASAGLLGILLAPPLIGFISEYLGLRVGLALVVAMALFAAYLSKRVKID